MWGALNSSNPTKMNPWYGFHRFKEGYGQTRRILGSFDLVINPILYGTYKLIDKIRWVFLKIKK